MYWVHLEFRLCHEFAGLPLRRHQFYWCDGFIPQRYELDGPNPRITGDVWIGYRGRDQQLWAFALLLPAPISMIDDVDWSALLPPPNMTRWMLFDEHRRYVEIEPAVAQPDLF